MLSFFTILLILIGANALLMVFSLAGSSEKRKPSDTSSVKNTASITDLLRKLITKVKKSI